MSHKQNDIWFENQLELEKPTDEDEFYNRMIAESEKSVKAAKIQWEMFQWFEEQLKKELK